MGAWSRDEQPGVELGSIVPSSLVLWASEVHSSLIFFPFERKPVESRWRPRAHSLWCHHIEWEHVQVRKAHEGSGAIKPLVGFHPYGTVWMGWQQGLWSEQGFAMRSAGLGFAHRTTWSMRWENKVLMLHTERGWGWAMKMLVLNTPSNYNLLLPINWWPSCFSLETVLRPFMWHVSRDLLWQRGGTDPFS